MKILLLIFVGISVGACDRLDRTYLPPLGSKISERNPGAILGPLDAPNIAKENAGENLDEAITIPQNGFENNVQQNIGIRFQLSPQLPSLNNRLNYRVPTTTTTFSPIQQGDFQFSSGPSVGLNKINFDPLKGTTNSNDQIPDKNYNNISQSNVMIKPGQRSSLNNNKHKAMIILNILPHLGQKNIIDEFSLNLSSQQPEYQQSVPTHDSLQDTNFTNAKSFDTEYESGLVMNQQNDFPTTQTLPFITTTHSQNINSGYSTPSQPSFDVIQIQGIHNFKNIGLPVDSINNLYSNRASQEYHPKYTFSKNSPPQPFQPISFATSTASSIFPKAYPISGLYPNSRNAQMLNKRLERIQAEADKNAIIIEYENNLSPDGDFSYSFDTSNGIHAEESGSSKDGVKAQGAFSYIGDDGKNYSITYTADENGYLPRGDHLPTPPPIPEAILKVIEQANQDKNAGIYHDGSYDDGKYGYKHYQEQISQNRPQIKSKSPLKQVKMSNETTEKSRDNKESTYGNDSLSENQNHNDDTSNKNHYPNGVQSDYQYRNHLKDVKKQQINSLSEKPIPTLSNQIVGMSNFNKLPSLKDFKELNENEPRMQTNYSENSNFSVNPFNNNEKTTKKNGISPKGVTNKGKLITNEQSIENISSRIHPTSIYDGNNNQYLPLDSTNYDSKGDDYQLFPSNSIKNGDKLHSPNDRYEDLDISPPKQVFSSDKETVSKDELKNSAIISNKYKDKNDIKHKSPLLYHNIYPDFKTFSTKKPSFLQNGQEVGYEYFPPKQRFNQESSSLPTKGFSSIQSENQNRNLRPFMTPKVSFTKDDGSVDNFEQQPYISNDLGNYPLNRSNAGLVIQGNKDTGRNSASDQSQNSINGTSENERQNFSGNDYLSLTVPRQHPTGEPHVTQRILDYSQETHPISSYPSEYTRISDRNKITQSRPFSNNRHPILNYENNVFMRPINPEHVSVGNIPSITYRPMHTHKYSFSEKYPETSSNSDQAIPRYLPENKEQEVSPTKSQFGYTTIDQSIYTTSRPKTHKEHEQSYQPGYPFVHGLTTSSPGATNKPYSLSDRNLFSTSPRTRYQENLETTADNSDENVEYSTLNPSLQADFEKPQGPLSSAVVAGEDFRGPKQPQYFDPLTGYHY